MSKPLKCMETCVYWEPVAYQDDYDTDEVKCYYWCDYQKHAIDDNDCTECDKYICRQ